jgi:hypothetical protein
MQSILLLPERRRFAGQSLSAEFAKRLGRAVRLSEAQAGDRAQLERYFTLQPSGWPMAAIQRRFDAGDADKFVWLRADPVNVRADVAGVRLMAWDNLELDDEESRRFLTALRPIFEEYGIELSATVSDRWFLRMPPGTALPIFSDPMQVLGADLFEHMPHGEAGRRWLTLLSEAQVILHNHPCNLDRATKGMLPVNSLWFWGGGSLPDSIRTTVGSVESPDPELLALSAQTVCAAEGPVLHDMRHVRDWTQVERRMPPDAEAVLDFADGLRWNLEPSQRWRFWRRPLRRLDT